MIRDLEISVSRMTRQVDLSKNSIGNDGENLQGRLVFSFSDEFVDGQGRLEYKNGDDISYVALEKGESEYFTPIKSVMTKKGAVYMQLVITEGTDEELIPIFKSNVFYVYVNESVNAEIEAPDEYQSWIDVANTKLNSIDSAVRYARESGDYAREQVESVVKANEEAEKIISEFDDNVDSYLTGFDTHVSDKVKEFDSHFDGKVDEFDSRVEEVLGGIDVDFEDINSEINTINTEISDINTNINTINDDISTINTNIETINTDINNLKDAVNGVETLLGGI